MVFSLLFGDPSEKLGAAIHMSSLRIRDALGIGEDTPRDMPRANERLRLQCFVMALLALWVEHCVRNWMPVQARLSQALGGLTKALATRPGLGDMTVGVYQTMRERLDPMAEAEQFESYIRETLQGLAPEMRDALAIDAGVEAYGAECVRLVKRITKFIDHYSH